jgi:hypothetical protein
MLLKNIEKDFPFISVVTYGGNEYVGIISNQDAVVTNMYVFTLLRSDDEKHRFLELGNVWWWESNRLIPINIFLRNEIKEFSYCQLSMNTKDVKITFGPCVNLTNLSVKRIKRKSVQLIRKAKN